MAILNIWTEVAAEKTIAEIQRALARAGAQAVMTEYDDDGNATSVSFRLKYNGQMVSFRLPAQIDPIYVIVQHEGPRPKFRSREHATRVAWRIVKDWIEAQLAMVEAEQVEMVEVFLPYAQDQRTGQTIFQKLAAGEFQFLLTHGGSNDG